MNALPIHSVNPTWMTLPDVQRPNMPLPSDSAFKSFHLESPQGAEARAREAATSFVASALLMPVLATLHESPLNLKAPFAPGVGEKRFAPMLDQHLSDRIARASNFGLVDSIVKRFTGNAASLAFDTRQHQKEFIDVRG